MVKGKSANTTEHKATLHPRHRRSCPPLHRAPARAPAAMTSPVRQTPRASPCWSGSAFLDTMALTAGKVMLDMAATAPAAHIILGEEAAAGRAPEGQPRAAPWLGRTCVRRGTGSCHRAKGGRNLPTPRGKRGQTLTKAAIRSRTRQAAGSGSLVPKGWCFYFLLNA